MMLPSTNSEDVVEESDGGMSSISPALLATHWAAFILRNTMEASRQRGSYTPYTPSRDKRH
jgi:hypothetical protein